MPNHHKHGSGNIEDSFWNRIELPDERDVTIRAEVAFEVLMELSEVIWRSYNKPPLDAKTD